MGSKTAAREAAIARRRAGRARHRGSRSTDAPDADVAADAERIGYPAGRQGRRRRRRQGHAHRGGPGRARRRRSRRAIGGGVGVRRRRGLSRAADRRAAAHRDPAARRRARHRRAVRRARVLDPAAAPEGRRGVAVDRARRRRCAARWPTRPRAVARDGRLHERRHDRVPARRGRPVLLPRDEHAAAGRASGHRDGHGRRSRAVAAPDRARRAADVDRSRAAHAARSRDRVPHLRRGSGSGASCRRPASSAHLACRRRARRPRRWRRDAPGFECPSSTTR